MNVIFKIMEQLTALGHHHMDFSMDKRYTGDGFEDVFVFDIPDTVSLTEEERSAHLDLAGKPIVLNIMPAEKYAALHPPPRPTV
ncbi:MAG: hypothetical protein KGL39_47080 [Patescibacteria group bacterium]|nr:hypothetical protein [Patescibacteria group bacterium]